MLAYTFWHWKRPDVAVEEYEARQRTFHEALGVAPPDSFSGSSCFAISGAPWAGDGGAAYEDWYLVRDSAALDALNAAAISASRQAPHDAAAAVAAGTWDAVRSSSVLFVPHRSTAIVGAATWRTGMPTGSRPAASCGTTAGLKNNGLKNNGLTKR